MITKEELLKKLFKYDEWSMLKEDPIFMGMLDSFFKVISQYDLSKMEYFVAPALQDESGDARKIDADELIFDINLKYKNYRFGFSLCGCLDSSLTVTIVHYVHVNHNEYKRTSTTYQAFLTEREVLQSEKKFINDDVVDSREKIYFYDPKFNPVGDEDYNEKVLDERFADYYDLDLATAHEYRLHFKDHWEELASIEAKLFVEDFLSEEIEDEFERPFTINNLSLFLEALLKRVCDYNSCEECQYIDVCPYEDDEDLKDGVSSFETEEEAHDFLEESGVRIDQTESEEQDENEENEEDELDFDDDIYTDRIDNIVKLFSKVFRTDVPIVISYQLSQLLEYYIEGDTKDQLKYDGVIITFEDGEYWRNFVSLTQDDAVINKSEVLSQDVIEDYRKKGKICTPSLKEFFSLGEGKHPTI